MIQSKQRKKRKTPQVLRICHPNAAGIDVGSRSHFVAVPPERDEEPVREFGTFTEDLHRLADWLQACGVTTVAMESTGVYWIPIYEVLEERFEVVLVNARHVRNVPGRKSDVLDCQWIQQLHSVGLLRASFRPGPEIVELRTYMRQRDLLVQHAAAHVQHMQKSLMEMNVQVHHVLADITGVTGMQIIRAIVAGERDPEKLAELRDPRCREPKERIAAALRGTFKREHLFTLQQALEAFDNYQLLLKQCDSRIEQTITALSARSPTPAQPCPTQRRQPARGNQPTFEIRTPLHRICDGVDLTQIPAIGSLTALNVLSEVGTDMTRWPTAKHFTSWMNLSPGTKITGGKLISGSRRPTHNRAGRLLRQAAVSIGRTTTALGAFFRRLAARRGNAKAVVATARKLAELIYRLLKYGHEFVDPGVEAYEQLQHERILRNLRKRATALGFQLVPAPATTGVT